VIVVPLGEASLSSILRFETWVGAAAACPGWNIGALAITRKAASTKETSLLAARALK
jgi:hypothetical protein